MRLAGWTSIIFAIIVFIGGMVGYAISQSTASAISGIVFGVLLVSGGIGTLFHKRWAAILSLVVTLLLDAFFSYRFMLSFSFMPSGMMAVLTLAALLLQVAGLRRSTRHAS